MIYNATVTKKGQATIPVEIRQFLDIKPYEKIIFIKKNNEIILKPTRDFLSLKGSVKTKKKYSDKKANQAIHQIIAKEYGKKRVGS